MAEVFLPQIGEITQKISRSLTGRFLLETSIKIKNRPSGWGAVFGECMPYSSLGVMKRADVGYVP
ncbi:MAG: hypothetical protein BMS9Abin13_400 [Patescibacteria group bacterium]|nr:MAG: hypothetical protein BMS9Abin13_400 [Patescibacteria group bacterium]